MSQTFATPQQPSQGDAQEIPGYSGGDTSVQWERLTTCEQSLIVRDANFLPLDTEMRDQEGDWTCEQGLGLDVRRGESKRLLGESCATL